MQMSTIVYMGEGGSKTPETGLRSLWMAPNSFEILHEVFLNIWGGFEIQIV